MNRRLSYWTALIGLLTTPLLAQAPRFYLSTERMFAPGQETTVTVETMALTYLDLRIYRIPDPTAFFATRSDLHQPRVRNVYGGPNALAILARAAEMDVIGWQALVRQFLSRDSRKNLLEGVPAWRNPPAALPQGRGHAEIPLLPGYTLVSQFRHYLAARGENWLYETIPLGLKEPGVYLVEGVCEGDAATTLAVVSELALVTKQSGNRLLSWVVQREGGQPVSGAQVTLFSGPGEKKLITAVTDASGLADLPLTGVPTPIVVVQKGPHAVVLDPSFYPAQLDHRKVYLTTDRPVYRPGQEVFFKGVARDFIAETYRVVSGKTAAVDLVDPRGHNVASVSARIGAMGTFSGSFALDDTPPLGTYKVVARLEGKSYQAEFRIREYQKPKFQVNVNLQGSPLNGEQVNAEVRARYYFGAPVTQGDVEYLVYRTRFYLPWWVEEDYNWYYSEAEYQNTRQELIAQGKGKLDPRGNLLFSFAVPPGSDDYTIRVEARVRDAGQFTVSGESSLQTSKGRFVITLKGDRLIAGKKDPVTVDIRTTDLARNPKSQVLTFTVVRPAGDRSGEKVLLTRAVQTDAQGRGQVRFAPGEMGLLHLVARGVDDLGKVITATTSLWVAAPGEKITYAGEGLTIVPNQRSYQVGDRARMLVLSKVPDQAFLFAVEGGDVYHYRVHRLTGNACLVDLPIETRHTPNVFVTASTVFAGQFYEARRNLIVPPRGQFLKVTLKPERPVYRPGDEVAVAVTSRDASGKPVPIEFSLGVVDEAIYAISPELAVEMPRFFYPSKRNNVRTFHSLAFNFYGYSESLKPQEGNRENREDSGLDSIKSARSERV
ncbi:MAG TPA: MG2 domain-containing protein, partial [Candidatus Aminicenantes bacterium]|nr:MG2 domain-containing protein [Candidatus Aminicenantes bacterium]